MTAPHRDTRALIEAYVDANRTGEISVLAEILAPDFRFRDSPPVGVAGVAAGVRALHAAFSELAISLEQCVCEGDEGAFRFVIAGTHSGVFAGRPPTGQRITWSGADFVRARGGKLAQLWSVQESLPLMEGVGAVARVL